MGYNGVCGAWIDTDTSAVFSSLHIIMYVNYLDHVATGLFAMALYYIVYKYFNT